jgi:hypothetical protein
MSPGLNGAINVRSLTNVLSISPTRNGIPQYHLDETILISLINTKSPTAGRNSENKYSNTRFIKFELGIFMVIKLQIKNSIHIAKKVSDIRNKDHLV